MGNSEKRVVKVVILTVILTLVLIGALIGGYFLYKNYNNDKLDEAFMLGVNTSLMEIAQGQTQSGNILTWQNDSIQVVSIQDICGERASI